MDYPKNNLWKWIVLYVLLATIVYGLMYYFFSVKNGGYSYNNQATSYNNQTSQTTETTGWKTYKNDLFELQYPSNLIVQEYRNSVNFYYNNDKIEGPLFIDMEQNSNILGERKQPMVGEKNIGGILGKIYNTGSVVGLNCQQIDVIEGEYTYTFDDNCNQNKDLFNQILSTFKFTK